LKKNKLKIIFKDYFRKKRFFYYIDILLLMY